MIDQVLARNFRGLSAADIHLDPCLTLVLGPNGSGKSSLCGAIEYALTGACEWTDGAGRGASVLIAHGSAGASVSVGGAQLGTIERQITAKGSSVAFDSRTGKEAEAAIGAALPGSALLPAMLRSDGFLRLSGKEQQDLLFGLSGGETDAEWFRERLSDEEVEVLRPSLVTLLKGSALADSLYKDVYDKRTGAGRLVKELQAATAGSGDLQTPDLAPLETELAKARTKLSSVTEKIGGAVAAGKAHQLAHGRWQQADAEVKRIQQAIADMGDGPPDATEDLAGLQATADARKGEYADAIQAAAEVNAVRQTLQDQLEKFVALGDKCVLGGVVCPMDKAARGKIIKQTQASIDKLEAQIAQQYEAATAAEQAYNEACDAVDAARRQEQAVAQHATRVAQLSEQLAQAQERRDTAQAEYQQTGAANTDGLEADKALLDRRITELETELSAGRLAVNQAQQAQQVAEDLAKARAEYATLDALVKKLSPDGLPAQAMRETIGAVMDAINEVLSGFTEFKLVAEPGKDFELLVQYGDSPLYPVRCLSESERLRVGVAIQVAFATLTGFGFVVVDAADRLDNVNRPRLLGMLLDSGVQALVLATPANGRVPQAEGLTVYTLAGGTASAVVEEAAA